MSRKFEDVPGLDLSQCTVVSAQIAFCKDLKQANEVHRLAASHYPNTAPRSLWLNAVGRWVVIMLTDAEEPANDDATSSSP